MNDFLRVLLMDDNPHDRALVERRRMEDALWQTGEYLRERAER